VFCDLVGSTALAEQRDPEAVREAVGRYLAGIRSAVEDHGGAVVKIIGDAALALFEPDGDPADAARRAVSAVFDVRDRLDVLNHDLEAEWGVRLSTHIGAATAPIVYVDAHPEVLVDGDAIDLATVLEQAAGTDEVVISLADGAGPAELLGPVTLADGRSCAAVRLRWP
jgi:class 3 adenylate cyclase